VVVCSHVFKAVAIIALRVVESDFDFCVTFVVKKLIDTWPFPGNQTDRKEERAAGGVGGSAKSFPPFSQTAIQKLNAILFSRSCQKLDFCSAIMSGRSY
jgi:hypothetical protein